LYFSYQELASTPGIFLFVSAIGTGSGHHKSIQVIDTIVTAGIPSQMYAFLYLGMVVMHFGFRPGTKPFLDKLRGSHDQNPALAELAVPSSRMVQLLPPPTSATVK